MRTFFLCLLTIFASIQTSAASFNQSPKLIPNDSTIKVLKVTNLKNQKVHYIFPSTKITYWYTIDLQTFKHTGILEGFSGDSLIVGNNPKPLSSITRIKKAANPAASFFKGIFGFGAFFLAALGIVGGGVLIQQNLWDPSIPMGFVAIILGVGAAILGVKLWKGLGKGHKKYKTEIVEVPAGYSEF